MQTRIRAFDEAAPARPWYAHPWPWLLMLGPFMVVLAGAYTIWLAISHSDALVVDDYYKEGKAINQSLQRDRIAASLKLEMDMRYDAAAGKLQGSVRSLGQPLAGKLVLSLIHPTQPEKDLRLDVRADERGAFSIELPMLERAAWQVQAEGERHDWRLHGDWAWPQQKTLALAAG